jgi:hypothetical protein
MFFRVRFDRIELIQMHQIHHLKAFKCNKTEFGSIEPNLYCFQFFLNCGFKPCQFILSNVITRFQPHVAKIVFPPLASRGS